MVTKEDLQNDDRFYIDEWNLDKFVAHKKIRKYRIKYIQLGSILRNLNKEIYELSKTDVYRYLEQDVVTEKDYEQYRRLCSGDDYIHHTLKSFQDLQEQLENTEYDIKKGAVVIDQFRCIIDGQHRSCILLKKYGPAYEIPVVQVVYSDVGIGTFIRWLLHLVKKVLR